MTLLSIHSVPREMQDGIEEIIKAFPHCCSMRTGKFSVDFVKDSALPCSTAKALTEKKEITVLYNDVSVAFRALGKLFSLSEFELSKVNFTETAAFKTRGLMIDCSRNGVIRPSALKDFLRRTALMGINMVMLYTEDTYEVPGEPFFGYLRGPFSQEELRDIDNYAASLGIEMIPCIQTLAHLEQILQWDPYFHLRDLSYILLAEDKKTYEFIEKIIKAASAPFRTKRIHVGMDEAHGLGTGRYKQLHGEKNPFDIMNTHLKKVRDICQKLGKKPMIWSDMYFRLGSKNHDYYDLKWKIPEKARKDIPKDVELVYWDYYHTDVDFYRKMIANHRKLGSDPVFGGGIWTWLHKWCALPWSFRAIDASMTACKAEKISDVFMTMWGDDGMEVDIFSALPGIQYYAEHVFSSTVQIKEVKRRFNTIAGSDFDDWVKAAGIDSVPGSQEEGKTWANTSVGLLWQDPFFAILDPHMKPWEWQDHYAKLGQYLLKKSKGGALSFRLEYPARIAESLSLKVSLRRDMERAYRTNDRTLLARIVAKNIPALIKALRQLHSCHRNMWMKTYKPFGWEVLEHRYGGLFARLETVKTRLEDYLHERIERIEELEAELHDPWKHMKERVVSVGHSRVKTPSCIK